MPSNGDKFKFPGDFTRAAESGIWRPKQAGALDICLQSPNERAMERFVREASDRSSLSAELAARVYNVATDRHLSPKRGNLLRPIRMNRDDSILEIGAGCGGLTRHLAETAGRVVAIESSPGRAAIAALRCAGLPNVEIVCTAPAEIDPAERFDLVILSYPSEPAYSLPLLMGKAKAWLKNNGVLALAAANKLGLKYFAGCAEDYSGLIFAGLEGGNSARAVPLFGRRELERLLDAAGFAARIFLHPFPDFEFPEVILRLDEPQAPFSNPFLFRWLNFENARRESACEIELFQEFMVTGELETNDLLAALSNSFLVLAGADAAHCGLRLDPDVLAWKFNVTRARRYMTQVRLRRAPETGALTVEREALFPESAQTAGPDDILRHAAAESAPLLPGASLAERMLRALRRCGATDFKPLGTEIKAWYAYLRGEAERRLKSATHLPGDYVDAIPSNLLAMPMGGLEYIDREWTYRERLPLKYVLFRGLLHTYYRMFASIDAHLGSALPEKTFRRFVDLCLRSLALEMAPEEFNECARLEWELQERIRLFSTGTFAEFLERLRLVPQSVFFQAKLDRIRARLEQVQAEYRSALTQWRHEHIRDQAKIRQMESSYFWKLRGIVLRCLAVTRLWHPDI